MNIDFVFPYVNPTDIEWQKRHIPTCRQLGKKIDLKGTRYRDWGLLKYLFRSIEQCAPFIRNVYMIVENMSQVPQWVNRDTVNIVCHKDIIPSQYLPTYNSCTIEMFLHNIRNLSEHFIYSNDDLYFMNMCEAQNFFNEDGKPIVRLKTVSYDASAKMFRMQCANCEDLFLPDTRKCITRKYTHTTYHTMTAMRVSTAREIWSKYHTQIEQSISTFRQRKNINQYIYPMYEYYVNNAQPHNFITSEYVAIGRESISDIIYKINNTKKQVICINDTMKVKNNEISSDIMHLTVAFNRRFHEKSKYEI